MDNHDAVILNVELESLADAHLRREEACRRRAALLIAQADRHAAIAKRLSAMQANLPRREDTEEANDLWRHFSRAFVQALAVADACEVPTGDTEHKQGWPDLGEEIPF